MERAEEERKKERKKARTARKGAVYSAACLFNALSRALHADNGPVSTFRRGNKGIMTFTWKETRRDSEKKRNGDVACHNNDTQLKVARRLRVGSREFEVILSFGIVRCAKDLSPKIIA